MTKVASKPPTSKAKSSKIKATRVVENDTEYKLRRKQEKPAGRLKVADLKSVSEVASDVEDKTIRRLIELGHITEIVAELKSGKEATAYVARNAERSVLVKVYRDLSAQIFKHNDVYRDGQTQTDQRAARAVKNRSRKGLALLQHDWVMSEYAHLWQLWQAGLSVPEPLVGPESNLYAETVPAVVMSLIGTEDQPAPRLSDARLSTAEAQSAWQQSVQGMADILRLGYVHGDYSTYNLLWWEGRVVIIDFPQLTTRQNPNFESLLARDAQSLSSSFRKHGIQATGEETLQQVLRLSSK